jgi:hypothetical protein
MACLRERLQGRTLVTSISDATDSSDFDLVMSFKGDRVEVSDNTKVAAG